MKDNIIHENENERKGNILLTKIIKSVIGPFDTFGHVCGWVDEDIFNLFDESLSNGIEFDEEQKKQLLSELVSANPTFFDDEFNVIYLKLVNLYNKVSKKSGEDEELYYITDRFQPNQKDENDIVEQMRDLISKNDLNSYVMEHFNYDSVLLPYKKARANAGEVLKDCSDDDVIFTETIEVLDSTLDTYGDKKYVAEVIADNRENEYRESIEKMGIASLATIYCEIKGSAFTPEEKITLSNELSQEQQDILSDVANIKENSETTGMHR